MAIVSVVCERERPAARRRLQMDVPARGPSIPLRHPLQLRRAKPRSPPARWPSPPLPPWRERCSVGLLPLPGLHAVAPPRSHRGLRVKLRTVRLRSADAAPDARCAPAAAVPVLLRRSLPGSHREGAGAGAQAQSRRTRVLKAGDPESPELRRKLGSLPELGAERGETEEDQKKGPEGRDRWEGEYHHGGTWYQVPGNLPYRGTTWYLPGTSWYCTLVWYLTTVPC